METRIERREKSKRSKRRKRTWWVKVSSNRDRYDEDNYIKYLLGAVPENITTKKRDGWNRSGYS